MRVLYCSPCVLDRRRGAAATLLNLAESLRDTGCDCTVIGPQELGASGDDYTASLRAFLEASAGDYDVVDCDFRHVPADRAALPARPLVVARVQLLLHQYVLGPTPRPGRDAIEWLRCLNDRRRKRLQLPDHERRLRAADSVVVLNSRDRQMLRSLGLEQPVHVVPNGIGLERRDALGRADAGAPAAPRVAFIGNLGPRKGSLDLPRIFADVAAAVPDVTFLLLGGGPQADAGRIRKSFPKQVVDRLEIVRFFEPEALGPLLADCSVGVFPSYAEGFGLGVVEMLAASVPVFAYDAAGPADILPERLLVPVGDRRELARRVASLLLDRERLATERLAARLLVAPYDWDRIAHESLAVYERGREVTGRTPRARPDRAREALRAPLPEV
jgi:glycosyltransferase involved in cell wall biosynthesis